MSADIYIYIYNFVSFVLLEYLPLVTFCSTTLGIRGPSGAFLLQHTVVQEGKEEETYTLSIVWNMMVSTVYNNLNIILITNLQQFYIGYYEEN